MATFLSLCLAVTMLVVFMLAISITLLGGWGNRRTRLYQQLAARFHGRFVPGGLFRQPRITLRHGEARVQILEAAARGPYRGPSTQVHFEIQAQRVACEIVPHATAAARSRLPLIPLDASPFAHAFSVRGKPEPATQKLLSDGVRWQLLRLLGLDDTRALYVMVWNTWMLVQKPRRLRRYEELEAFVEAALDLYDQIQLTHAEGIAFLRTDEGCVLQDVTCKVCGESIDGDLVYCRRCRTPHHGECWQYVGRCSIFGCEETRFLQ